MLLFAAEGVALYSTYVLRDAVDSIEHPGRFTIPVYAMILLGLVVVQGATRFGSRYYMGYSSRHIEFELRNDFFGHLIRLEPAYYVENSVGDLVSRAINDLNAVRQTLGQTLMFFSSSVVRVPAAVVLMATIDARLLLVTLIPFVAMPFIMQRLSTQIHSMFESIQEQFSAMSAKVRESFMGVRVVKAYAREASEIASFGAMNTDYIERNKSLIRLESLIFPMFMFLPGLSFLLLLWVGGVAVSSGSLTFGQFTQFNTCLLMLIFPMASFGFTWSGLQRGAASMGRLSAIMDRTPAIVDPDGLALPEPPIHGDLEFRNLSFGYGDEPVLHDVSVRVPSGSTLAIVGPTGAGKSTLVHLIARLYTAQPGMVLVDGRDVGEYSLKHLRSAIGFVQQESFLFSDSIADNLRFGDPEATDPHLEDASRLAHLLPEIEEFPMGFGTELGERGAMISGGQRQRTSLARALLRRPSILVLDDAFASVDTYTEETILNNLRDYGEKMTLVIISHRVSTVKHADEIVVLNEGTIAERGTHEALLSQGGFYQELFEKQRLEEELERL
ncbi:ABC transporter ATP-binding protein [Candidatus Poribacteria bacterium]|nr:ABC transporter ATP-binding protein [Candidatus Poribacteria bacterium]